MTFEVDDWETRLDEDQKNIIQLAEACRNMQHQELDYETRSDMHTLGATVFHYVRTRQIEKLRHIIETGLSIFTPIFCNTESMLCMARSSPLPNVLADILHYLPEPPTEYIHDNTPLEMVASSCKDDNADTFAVVAVAVLAPHENTCLIAKVALPHTDTIQKLRILMAIGCKFEFDRETARVLFYTNYGILLVSPMYSREIIRFIGLATDTWPKMYVCHAFQGLSPLFTRNDVTLMEAVRLPSFDPNYYDESSGSHLICQLRTSNKPVVVRALLELGACTTGTLYRGEPVGDLPAFYRKWHSIECAEIVEMSVERSRLVELCIGMRALDLPVLVVEHIYAATVEYPTRVSPIDTWNTAKTVKHYNHN